MVVNTAVPVNPPAAVAISKPQALPQNAALTSGQMTYPVAAVHAPTQAPIPPAQPALPKPQAVGGTILQATAPVASTAQTTPTAATIPLAAVPPTVATISPAIAPAGQPTIPPAPLAQAAAASVHQATTQATTITAFSPAVAQISTSTAAKTTAALTVTTASTALGPAARLAPPAGRPPSANRDVFRPPGAGMPSHGVVVPVVTQQPRLHPAGGASPAPLVPPTRAAPQQTSTALRAPGQQQRAAPTPSAEDTGCGFYAMIESLCGGVAAEDSKNNRK